MGVFDWHELSCPIDLGYELREVGDRQLKTVANILDTLQDRKGVILADEVGMGKTYIAIGVAAAVLAHGGRVQICVPRNVMHKWVRDIKTCAAWFSEPDNIFAKYLRQPVPLLRYSDVFWYRVGLQCRGLQACKKCQRYSAEQHEKCQSPWDKSPNPLPLQVWHPGATYFQFICGNKKATGRKNFNVQTFLFAILFHRGKLKDLKKWWGGSIEEEGSKWQVFARRVRQLSEMKGAPLPVPQSVKGTLKGTMRGKKLLQWYKKGSVANRRFCNAITKEGVRQALWHAFAGVPDLLIVDEAHKGKSDHSLMAQSLEQLRGKPVKVLALTATPFDLSVKEIERLLDRIWISEPNKDLSSTQSEEVTKACSEFAKTRDKFVSFWAAASEELSTETLPLPSLDAEQISLRRLAEAQSNLRGAKNAYESVLRPWIMRAKKSATPPYNRFPSSLEQESQEGNAYCAHPHRNMSHKDQDLLDTKEDVSLTPEDFQVFLKFERLERETREAFGRLRGKLGNDWDGFLKRCRGKKGLSGTAHFVSLPTAYDYFDVGVYQRHLQAIHETLRDGGEGEHAQLLNVPIRRSKYLIDSGIDSEKTKQLHPKINAAFRLITDLCDPVCPEQPDREARKVLIFSFNKAPLKHLRWKLSLHAASRMVPHLLALRRRVHKGSGKIIPYQWTGLSSSQDLGDELSVWNSVHPDAHISHADLAAAAGIPIAVRRRSIGGQSWEDLSEKWAQEQFSEFLSNKENYGTDQELIHKKILRCATQLLFSHINLARWSAQCGGNRTLESLIEFSMRHVKATIRELFKHTVSAGQSEDHDDGLMDDGSENYPIKAPEKDEDGERKEQVVKYQLREMLSLSQNLRWCDKIDGNISSARRRWALQMLFNTPAAPHVLLVQSTMCREGIDLHRFCRHLVHYDLEWTPGAMEQREGRVDRVNSLWETDFSQWEQDGASGPPPRIEVYALRFRGHYDDVKWRRLRRRQAELFAGIGASLIDDREIRNLKQFTEESFIEQLLPDFQPLNGSSSVP